MNQIKNSKILILVLSAVFSAIFLFLLPISAFAADQTHTLDGSFNITVQGSSATNVIDSSLETASTLDTNILVCCLVFLLLGGVLFIFVKSRSLAPTTAANAKTKSQIKNPLFITGLIIAVLLFILISMILVKSSAFADKSASDITYSSNVLVDEQGNVLNNDLKIINGSSSGIVIKEIVAPSELNGWKAKLEKDLLIKAGETVECSWDTTAVPSDTLNKVKSAGGSMSLNISINITEDYTLDFDAFDADLNDVIYNGQAQTPKVTTSFYKEDEDYSVEYANNKDVGTATITIKGIGGHDGQKVYTFNIHPREVSLIWSDTTFNYDKNSHLPKVTAENIVGEDKVNVTVNTADGSDAINAGKYTACAISLDNSNYCLPSDISCSFVINQATLTLTWDEQSLKHTYNGGEHIPTATISGAYEGDTVNLTISGKAKTAGTHTATASIDNNNYKFDKEPTKEFSISCASVTVSGITANKKTYDGNTSATLDYSNVTLTGKVDGDDLSVTATGTFTDKNAGAGKNVSISGLTLQGGSKDNYELAKDGQQASATADIEARTVSLNWSETEFTYNCKNQKPTATVDGSSIITGETVEVNAYDTEGGKDFGDYEIKATGLSNNNYQLPSDAVCKFNITKADIDVTGITISPKEYDKTTGANIATVTISGIYSSDSDKVDVETTGTFADVNVGVGKTVTITNTLSGERSFNYQISSSVIKSTTADIVAKEVTLSWSATALPYNSEVQKPTATVDASSIISGDTVEVATYEGEGGTTFGDYSITAKTLDNDNYKLPKDATCNFKITQADVTVTDITASNKTYDKDVKATLSDGKVSGIFDADKSQVTVTSTGEFDTVDAGTDKNVTITSILSGDKSNNYKISENSQKSTTADIEAKEVRLVWSAYEIPYNSEIQRPTVSVSDSSIITGDTVTVSIEGEGGKDCGEYKVEAKTLSNNNYKLPSNTICDFKITQADITVTVTVSSKQYDGKTDATLSDVKFTGVFESDTGQVNVTSTGIFTDSSAGNNKWVLVTSTLSGDRSKNYKISDSSKWAKGNITKATPTVTVTARIKAKWWKGSSWYGYYTGDVCDVSYNATGLSGGLIGSVSWNGSSEQTEVNSGSSTEGTWTFTPNDTNYDSVTGTCTLTCST